MQTPFNVTETTPLNDMSGVDINKTIELKFSHELDRQSIDQNILLLKNFNEEPIDKENFDVSLFEKVKVKMTYENRTIYLKSIEQLDKNTEYIIYVSNQVKNSIDDYLFKTLIVNFKTSYEHQYKAPTIISPEYGQVVREKRLKVKFYNLESMPEAYEIQLSKEKNFENVIAREVIKNTSDSVITHTFEEILPEGNYYIRVRAINGLFSKTYQFFSKPDVEKGEYLGLDDEDLIDDIIPVRELTLVETFPEDGFSNVSTRINIIYLKFLGKLTFEDFDINNSSIEGELIDMNDMYEGQSNHGYIDGDWEIVYDQRTNHSYLINRLKAVM